MSRDIAESDWKKFKEVHPLALDRFFQRAVDELRPLLNAEGKTAKDQFWDVLNLAKERRKEAAQVFDGPSRSSAMLMTAALIHRKLLTEEEISRFSPDLKESVQRYLGIARD